MLRSAHCCEKEKISGSGHPEHGRRGGIWKKRRSAGNHDVSLPRVVHLGGVIYFTALRPPCLYSLLRRLRRAEIQPLYAGDRPMPYLAGERQTTSRHSQPSSWRSRRSRLFIDGVAVYLRMEDVYGVPNGALRGGLLQRDFGRARVCVRRRPQGDARDRHS